MKVHKFNIHKFNFEVKLFSVLLALTETSCIIIPLREDCVLQEEKRIFLFILVQ